MSQRVHDGLPRLAPGLAAREVAGDIVVVDPTTQTAHALSGAVADAYRALSRDERPAGSEAEVAAVMGELAAKNLLEKSLLTRRLMLQRAGTVAVATGLMSISLPAVAANASGQNNVVGTTVSGQPVEATIPVGTTFSIKVTVTGGASGGTVYLTRRGPNGPVPVGKPPVGSGSTTDGQAAYSAGGVTFTGIKASDSAGGETFDVSYTGTVTGQPPSGFGSSAGTASATYSLATPAFTMAGWTPKVNGSNGSPSKLLIDVDGPVTTHGADVTVVRYGADLGGTKTAVSAPTAGTTRTRLTITGAEPSTANKAVNTVTVAYSRSGAYSAGERTFTFNGTTWV